MLCSTSFIDSASWGQILQDGFDARRLEIPLEETAPLAWTIFRKMQIRVAYARFPVGLERNAISPDHFARAVLPRLRTARADIARVSIVGSVQLSQFGWVHEAELIESVIEDLQGWSEKRVARSVRAKLNKGQSAGVVVRSARLDEGGLIYQMYAEMIARHKGRLRYTRKYFNALCRASLWERRLSIGVVCDTNGVPAGFIVVCHSPCSSHYLHSGFRSGFSRLRPGYCAMAWAIEQSREFGSRKFNMLTSPVDQPSLVAYKESFGATSSPRQHYAVPLNWVGRMLLLRRLAAHSQRPGPG